MRTSKGTRGRTGELIFWYEDTCLKNVGIVTFGGRNIFQLCKGSGTLSLLFELKSYTGQLNLCVNMRHLLRYDVRIIASVPSDPWQSVCATLLTLHILDSRPLTETLVTMLEQRTKALRTLLQQNSPASSHDKYSSQNSFVEKSTIFRRMPVDDSKDAIRLLLDLVFITARVARQIFKSVESSPSLIDRILLHFQTGTTPQAEQDSPIAELYLTSQTLLLSLPSSTHFLLLPANIKSYKPFIDPDSQSSFVSQTTLTLKLDEWFNKSLEVIRPSVAQWLSSLKTIKELWSVRLAITNWIRESELLANEARIVEKLFDDLHGSTASQIWISRIHHTEQNYTHKLQKVVAEFSNPVCLHSAGKYIRYY